MPQLKRSASQKKFKKEKLAGIWGGSPFVLLRNLSRPARFLSHPEGFSSENRLLPVGTLLNSPRVTIITKLIWRGRQIGLRVRSTISIFSAAGVTVPPYYVTYAFTFESLSVKFFLFKNSQMVSNVNRSYRHQICEFSIFRWIDINNLMINVEYCTMRIIIRD
jgi:hypothetical protein